MTHKQKLMATVRARLDAPKPPKKKITRTHTFKRTVRLAAA